MKALLLISVLALSSSLDFTAFPAEDYSAFLKGFVVGLGAGDTDCSAAMTQLTKSIQITVQDVANYNTGSYLPIVMDLNSMRTQLTALTDICDIAGLENQINRLLGPSGKAMLMKNYIMHTKAINKDMDILRNCTTNFFTCGQSAGDIFKIMVGWSLSSPVTLGANAVGINKKDIFELIGSTLGHIEWYAPEYCSDMFKLVPSTSQFIEDFYHIVHDGDRESVKDLINIVLGVLAEDQVIHDCTMAYAGMMFYTIPTVLADSRTWKIAYFQETQDLLNLISAVATDCSSNYYMCGANLAKIINMMVSYGDL